MLAEDKFKTLVDIAPLISIDLILKNEKGEVLLGKRKNKPAYGFFFVPGGRVRKNEKLGAAFQRLVQTELGIAISGVSRKFLGVYEHFYDDCFCGNNTSTHYIVLAYELFANRNYNMLPQEQHSQYSWMNIETLSNSDIVHQYTKDYFNNSVVNWGRDG